jgi:hypothetical protein
MSGSHLCIPRNETVISKTDYNVMSPSSYTHISICEKFIYFHDRSDYSAAGKYVDRSWEYKNLSQTHEWKIGTEAAQFPENEYINRIFVEVW